MTEQIPSSSNGTVPNDSALFQGIYDALPDPTVLTDTDRRIRLVNIAFDRLFGRHRADVIGRSVEDLFVEALNDTDDRETFDRTCRSGDDETFCGRVSVSEVLSGSEPVGFLYHIRDISIDLDTTDALLKAKNDAELAVRTQSELLAKISHEIRTPMNGVVGMTELMLNSSLSHAQREYAESIFDSSESLLKLVNDLLDLSKIEAGKMELESTPFDLYRLAGQVVELFAPQADAKGIRIGYDVDPALPPEVIGDSLRLRQVITNLVSNAVKFTEEGEVITRVALNAAVDGTASIGISVSDTGIGIAESEMHRLFEAFGQASDSTARHYGGTGLGLAISRQLVELMGGSLDVRSAPGGGSTFEFEIELGAGGSVPDRPDDEQALADLSVLLVDGSDSLRAIVASYLRRWQIDVHEARDASDAVRSLALRRYDAALISNELEDMSGL
ncbi:MAG: ATP-binding protein, partial [Rhodothermales bacterium]